MHGAVVTHTVPTNTIVRVTAEKKSTRAHEGKLRANKQYFKPKRGEEKEKQAGWSMWSRGAIFKAVRLPNLCIYCRLGTESGVHSTGL